MKNFLKSAAERYPFTFPGSILFFSSIVILGKGFASSNETAVAVSFFFLIFTLADWGYLFFCSRFYSENRVVWKSEGAVDSTGYSLNTQTVTVPERAPFVFTRYSAVLRGMGKTSGPVFPYFSARHRSDRKGILLFSFYFPWTGTVTGKLSVFIEDVFAVARIRIFTEELKEFAVIPGINPDASADSKTVVKDMVTQQKRHDNDIEKYLMREYVPGDLYRDINWKSSGRIDKLVTRISPGGKEEANRLTFVFLGRGYSTLPDSGKRGDPSAGKRDARGSHVGGFGESYSIYENFITGKYFREFFYTFIHLIKAEAGNCELRIIVDGQECRVKEAKELYGAGQLLALSAAGSTKLQHDLSYLSDINEPGSFYLFAETTSLLRAALGKLDRASVSGCYVPLLSGKSGWSAMAGSSPGSSGSFGGGSISFFRRDFIFSAVFAPLRFYRDLIVSTFFRAINSPSVRDNKTDMNIFSGRPGTSVRLVEIFSGKQAVSGRGKIDGESSNG